MIKFLESIFIPKKPTAEEMYKYSLLCKELKEKKELAKHIGKLEKIIDRYATDGHTFAIYDAKSISELNTTKITAFFVKRGFKVTRFKSHNLYFEISWNPIT